ncbi:hypothetical protein [Mesorhizobium sp. B4-1-1]|uniref:hypothetical protein n=1 Tax=Mesorhizobium sp. B4-1-1 TaxID=2589890 RepID=UPI001129FFC7|nr:hypothetical protein [Mesorhizobium sp. B4-1-1]TPI10281.1 hypothetical protein FJW10_29660 [Mesorhizobium sp. B4-1-1]
MRSLLDMVKINLKVPRGEAGFWSIILKLDAAGPWTIRQVGDRTNSKQRIVDNYVRRLLLAGFVEIAKTEPRKGPGNFAQARYFRLLKSPLIAPRIKQDGTLLPETGNEQVWRAIRMLKSFSALELHEHCASEVAPGSAGNYARALAATGVIVGTWPNYRLVRDLGPAAPKLLTAKMVFDPNTSAVLGDVVAREAGS